MSGVTGSSTEGRRVYVRLLDEGTAVYRPAHAEFLGRDRARLLELAEYDSADEKWEFAPGTIVEIEERTLDGEQVCVAVAAVK